MPFFGVTPIRGDVIRCRVPIGQLADGSDAYVPLILIEGWTPGPTAYLQAGIHGDEITAIEVCRRVVASIDPEAVRGRIVVVPIGNVPAYLNRKRSFVEEERGPIDMNRIFPGDRAGLLTERIAAALVEEMLSPADYALDFHSALAGCHIAPCAYVSAASGTPVRARQEALAESLAWDLTCLQEGVTQLGHTNLSKSFCAVAEEMEVPAIIAELGQSGRISQDLLDLGVAGVRRVLIDNGNLSAPRPPAPEASTRYRSIAFVHAERGGIVDHHVGLSDRVSAGQLLGVVHDPVTDEAAEFISPVDGIVLRQLLLGTCSVGAELVWVAHDIVDGDSPR